VRATGLNARIGQQVEIRDPAGGPVVKAEVVGLSDGAAILTPLTSLNGLGPEAEVIAAEDRTEVPSGPGLLGRVIDAFGRPLDSLGPIAGPVALREVYADAPNPLARPPIDAPFATEVADLPAFGELRGRNVSMRELFSTLSRLARTDLSILVEGQTGTGKELAARGVHDASTHAAGPFVVLDCTAIPSTLAESVLFGHERGAFTGANERRVGVFEAAEGGTVFLDEVGELPLELQPKLLRVLERREVVRVGSTTPRPVQVRVISATWRDLRTMINQGKFREDLYYRLAQARVTIPPMRERPEDVPLLVYHFLQRLPPGQGARAISPEALAELQRREYAGNVRELKSTVERAAMMAEGAVITNADLAFERMLSGERVRAPALVAPVAPAAPSANDPIAPFKEAKRTLIDEFEKAYLQRLLQRTGNNLSRAAALAGIERHYLRDLFRKHGLRSDE
jgi:DNA-binding NtrC family response regulator